MAGCKPFGTLSTSPDGERTKVGIRAILVRAASSGQARLRSEYSRALLVHLCWNHGGLHEPGGSERTYVQNSFKGHQTRTGTPATASRGWLQVPAPRRETPWQARPRISIPAKSDFRKRLLLAWTRLSRRNSLTQIKHAVLGRQEAPQSGERLAATRRTRVQRVATTRSLGMRAAVRWQSARNRPRVSGPLTAHGSRPCCGRC
ncbi:hypothetical protein J2T22_001111 [Pseudarthrobacter defluvii]|uniref:Tn3 transposase DDE domain-containing protein n=1 Tax=Pseudarthrobacter defluvii TaxID=410837 RepID=A0ABT9UG53_9MICC|nr:hypothetical protein [Pseudarthrobacter defluvii]